MNRSFLWGALIGAGAVFVWQHYTGGTRKAG